MQNKNKTINVLNKKKQKKKYRAIWKFVCRYFIFFPLDSYCISIVRLEFIGLILSFRTPSCISQANQDCPIPETEQYPMASTSTSSIPLREIAKKPSFSSAPPAKIAFLNPLRFSFSSRPSIKVICSSVKYNEVVVDEEMDKIKRLQNGSDVRGVALEGEKGRTVDLNAPAVEAIAESFGEWVIKALETERGRPVEDVRVSLGKDPRISGASLSVAVFAGLSRAGCLVFDIGLATTPACFMSTLLPPFAYDASIMVTLIGLMHKQFLH